MLLSDFGAAPPCSPLIIWLKRWGWFPYQLSVYAAANQSSPKVLRCTVRSIASGRCGCLADPKKAHHCFWFCHKIWVKMMRVSIARYFSQGEAESVSEYINNVFYIYIYIFTNDVYTCIHMYIVYIYIEIYYHLYPLLLQIIGLSYGMYADHLITNMWRADLMRNLVTVPGNLWNISTRRQREPHSFGSFVASAFQWQNHSCG